MDALQAMRIKPCNWGAQKVQSRPTLRLEYTGSNEDHYIFPASIGLVLFLVHLVLSRLFFLWPGRMQWGILWMYPDKPVGRGGCETGMLRRPIRTGSRNWLISSAGPLIGVRARGHGALE